MVVDANLTLALVLLTPYSTPAAQRVSAWKTAGEHLLAPALWGYEVASALRKSVAGQVLTDGQAELALAELLALGVELVPPDQELLSGGLRWAQRLGSFVAYDAAYMALAERYRCDLWTADRRMARAAAGCGADWVHLIGN